MIGGLTSEIPDVARSATPLPQPRVLPLGPIGHLPVLDGLRGIAILAVLSVHLYSPIFGGGGWGVDLFFVLSGFLITKLAYEEHERTGRLALKQFYLRRFFRLQPAALLMLAVMLWSSWTIFSDVGVHLRRQIGLTALLSGNLYALFFDDSPRPALGHTWSLGLEEQFYFVWPFLLVLPLGAAFIKPRRFALILAIFAAATVLIGRIVVAGVIDYPHWASIPLFNVDGLALGCLLAIFLHTATRPAPRWRPGMVWACLAVMAFTLFAGGEIIEIDRYGIQRVVLRVVFAYLIMAAVLYPTAGPMRVFHQRTLQFFGLISYSLYLWHVPVFYFFERETFAGTSRIVLASLKVGLSIAFALASFVLVERPTIRFYRRWRGRQPARLAAIG